MAKGGVNVTGGGGPIIVPKNRIYIPYGSDIGYDDEFDDGVLDSSWIKIDKTGYENTWIEPEGLKGISLLSPSGKGVEALTGLLKPLGALTYPCYIETAIRSNCRSFNYPAGALIFANGATYGAGSQTFSALVMSNAYTTQGAYSNFNARGSYQDSAKHGGANQDYIYARYVWVNANTFRSYFSVDGVVWLPSHDNTNYSITPTHCGFGCVNFDNSYYDTIFNFAYFRVRSGLPVNG